MTSAESSTIRTVSPCGQNELGVLARGVRAEPAASAPPTVWMSTSWDGTGPVVVGESPSPAVGEDVDDLRRVRDTASTLFSVTTVK